MQKGSKQQVTQIREAIKTGNGMQFLDDILTTLSDTKALDFAMDQARSEAKKAIDSLSILPESDYKQALIALANLSVSRDH
jgi:octaprenyl-diphosphate synthase